MNQVEHVRADIPYGFPLAGVFASARAQQRRVTTDFSFARSAQWLLKGSTPLLNWYSPFSPVKL